MIFTFIKEVRVQDYATLVHVLNETPDLEKQASEDGFEFTMNDGEFELPIVFDANEPSGKVRIVFESGHELMLPREK